MKFWPAQDVPKPDDQMCLKGQSKDASPCMQVLPEVPESAS